MLPNLLDCRLHGWQPNQAWVADMNKGKEHSSGLRDKFKAHEMKKQDKKGLYESESECEIEYGAFVSDEEYSEGMDFTN